MVYGIALFQPLSPKENSKGKVFQRERERERKERKAPK
jgi:hypothetical protein